MADFRILGPLQVVVDGAVTRIGPRKHRILLATLLLQLNRPVPVDTLIDRLWRDAPPRGARRTVQTYVARLRQELGRAGHHIHTRPDAYSIEAETESLDLSRFMSLTRQAATARSTGDDIAARFSLGQALGLWRGPPLADVPPDGLDQAIISHLTELRAQAIEQRISLDLNIGTQPDPNELVAELRQLVAEYPLRERFWLLLMRALSHAGRPAEASAAYHDANRLLRAELGASCGPELRRLHTEILAEAAAPAYLPVPSRHNEADLRRLHWLLTEALHLVDAMTVEADQSPADPLARRRFVAEP
jgi:DNA-binding SARP family transcriptional activator